MPRRWNRVAACPAHLDVVLPAVIGEMKGVALLCAPSAVTLGAASRSTWMRPMTML
jgi:hypothetical protein